MLRGDPALGTKGLTNAVKMQEAFRIQSVRSVSAVETFTKALEKQDITFGKLIKSRQMMNKVIMEQQRIQRMSVLGVSQGANGAINAETFIPRSVPARVTSFRQSMAAARAGQISFAEAVRDSRLKLGLWSQAVASAAQNGINLGKNLQWTGRQLTMGLTLPLVMFGAAAGKIANDVDRELTRIVKVYQFTNEEMSTQSKMSAASDELKARAMDTARQSAALYGSKLEDTLAIEAELAAAGKRGLELQQMTNVVNRAATLGELNRQDAMKATITLQNVYGLGAKGLGDAFNYINQLENNTSVQAQDMVTAIPKVSAVVKSLGGTLQDTGTLMTAATVGGIKASEAANTLKTVLFRVATGQGNKTFLATTGKDLNDLRKEAGGKLIPWLKSVGDEIDKIRDPQKKTTVLKDLLGVYQGAKGGTIFDQLSRNTEQVQAALDAAGETVDGINTQTNVWAATADREIKSIQMSASGRLKIAIQSMRANLAEMGKPFIEMASKVVGALGTIVHMLNQMPGFMKKGFGALLLGGAIIGPIVMITGLFINLINTIAKAGASVTGLAAKFKATTAEEQTAALLAKQASGAYLSEAESIRVLNIELSKMTQMLAGLPGQIAAANGVKLTGPGTGSLATMLLGPNAKNIKTRPDQQDTRRVVSPVATGGRYARETVEYKREELLIQEQINKAQITEAQGREALIRAEARLNPYIISRQRLHDQLLRGEISMVDYQTRLNELGLRYDEMYGVRLKLQAQVNEGLITEVEMKQMLLREEQAILRAREEQVLAARMQQQRVSAVSGGKLGTGLMTASMVGMMVGSMGMLNSSTSKWVSTLATGLFVMSAMIPVARGLQSGVGKVTAAFAKAKAGAVAANTATKGLVTTTKLWGKAVWASLGPYGLIAAAVALVAAGMLLLFRRADNIKKKMDSWGDTSKRTADQVGISLGGGFQNAAGKVDKFKQSISEAIKEGEKWAKANPESLKIVSNTKDQKAAAAEVNRIGVDIYEATGNAKKAKEAMLLAINGSGNKGLEVRLNLENAFTDKTFQKQLDDASNTIVNTIAKSDFNLGEKMKFWNFGPKSLLKDMKDQLSDTGISASKTLAKGMAEVYNSGNLDMFTKKVKSTNKALDDAVKNGTMSQSKANEARKEVVRELINQHVISKDAVKDLYDLGGAEEAMTAALTDATNAQLALNAGMEDGSADIQVSAELLQKLNGMQQEIMKSAWGDVLAKAADHYDEVMQGQMDAVVAQGQRAMDAIDAEAKNKDKDFDNRAKVMDKKYKDAEDNLKARQKARRDRDDKTYEDQIKKVEGRIDAEKKLEEQRQKMFEAEQTRIQRLSEMYNKNVDLNVALNSGNMDEAAKIQNDMASTQDSWAVSDTAAASADASQGTQDSLEKQKDVINSRKDAHDAYLDSVEKKENDALDAAKERDKEALDSAKERYHEQVEEHKKHQERLNADAQRGEARRQKLAKESLDADLALWNSYIPQNEADMRSHIAQLEDIYKKHGVVLNTKSAEWGTSIANYITKATNTAKGQLAGDQEWALLGRNVGDKLMKGMLGMSVDEFNAWIANGARADSSTKIPPMPSTFHGSPDNWKRMFSHGGGLVGAKTSDRAGRSMSAGLFHDEEPHILQKGEFVVDKHTTKKVGPGFLQRLKDGTPGRVPETGGPSGLMAGIGEKVLGGFASAMNTAIPIVVQKRADSELAKGHTLPPQIQKFLGNLATPGEAGKYGDVALNASQLANAAAIIGTGRSMGATDRDIIIALMTALQESSLKNIAYGDNAGPDSRGLFQQRDSWGTLEERMNPSTAARLFFEREMHVKGREKMPLTQVAQKVQVSAYPNAYAKWENEARAILAGTIQGNSKVGYGGGKGGRGVDSINDIIGLIAGKGIPFRPTSTYRPGSITHSAGTLSYHATKNAVDFGSVPAGRDNAGLLAINRFFAGLGRGLNELIYSGPGGINLRNGAPHTYDATTRADHHDHVHVAATKDALSKLPHMKIGGEVLYDNTIANLHRKETVLTAPLSEDLKRGIQNLDSTGNSEYNILMDMRGSTIDHNFDIDGALEKAIQRREAKAGRSRKIGP